MANQAVEPRAPLDIPPVVSCLHSRLIDDVLTKDGARTGQVRCLECGAVFDDPSCTDFSHDHTVMPEE